MQALVFDGRDLRVRDHAEPEPLDGMAIVRPLLAGICNTDLEIARGYMGFRGVLGHEVVGVVEEGPAELAGERVVCEINFACGECPSCAEGLGRHCPKRSVMGIVAADGCFAERVAVPLANLHRVPHAIPDERAVFSEPLAAAFEILEQTTIEAGVRCLVLGDGKLGCLVAQVLADAGGRVRVVGHHPETLAWLARRGIESVLEADWRDPDAERCDLTVEATGSSRALELAARATRPRGTVVLKSTVAEPHAIDLAPFVIHELTVVGSRCGPFPPALAALASGSVETEPLVAQRYPLSKGIEAFALAGQRGVRKVLIDAR